MNYNPMEVESIKHATLRQNVNSKIRNSKYFGRVGKSFSTKSFAELKGSSKVK